VRLLEVFRALLMACVLGLSMAGWAAPQEAMPAQVEQARDQLRADPNLQDTQTQHRLRLKNSTASQSDPAIPAWLLRIAQTLAVTGRLLVWVLGGLLLIGLALGFRRWLQMRAEAGPRANVMVLPTHVHELDIRPESLPNQVGATAWGLWQRGEPHAALSLLYRATLSRLVHAHAVPITSASTEGECIQLAKAAMASGPLSLVEQVIDAWRLAVYGSRTMDAVVVQALCQRFDTELSPQAPRAHRAAS
jgi:hypothetical protein